MIRNILDTFNRHVKIAAFAFSFIFLAAGCGGGGGGGGTTSSNIAVSGTVDLNSIATAKPNRKAGAVKTAVSPVSGATVIAIGGNGTVTGSTTL